MHANVVYFFACATSRIMAHAGRMYSTHMAHVKRNEIKA